MPPRPRPTPWLPVFLLHGLLLHGLLLLLLLLPAFGLLSCGGESPSGENPGAAAPQATPETVRTWRPAAPPTLPRRPLKAGFLLVDGVFNTELVAPFDVFEHTRAHGGARPAIEVLTISPDGEPVTTAEGLVVAADHSFADHPPLDLLVVASAVGSRDEDLEDEELISWVAHTGAGTRWVMSLCWGAYVLAEAGLLDGHAATTFPPDQQDLARRYPEVDVRVGASLVYQPRAYQPPADGDREEIGGSAEGGVLTSAGGVESFPAALFLADHLYGEEVAAGLADGLLVPWPPDGETQEGFVLAGTPSTGDLSGEASP